MSRQITLELPDDVFRRAEGFARASGRDVTSVLTDTLDTALPDWREEVDAVGPVSVMSNADVLALADSRMAPHQDQRLSELLYAQQARELSNGEREELARLMQVYEVGMVRKAAAQAEAVRRGLRAASDP
jgi:hypothetical protein